MWKCYHCEKEIAPRAPTCPHCGGTFNASSRGFMSSNARAHENYEREKQGLPPKSGCAVMLGGFISVGVLFYVAYPAEAQTWEAFGKNNAMITSADGKVIVHCGSGELNSNQAGISWYIEPSRNINSRGGMWGHYIRVKGKLYGGGERVRKDGNRWVMFTSLKGTLGQVKNGSEVIFRYGQNNEALTFPLKGSEKAFTDCFNPVVDTRQYKTSTVDILGLKTGMSFDQVKASMPSQFKSVRPNGKNTDVVFYGSTTQTNAMMNFTRHVKWRKHSGKINEDLTVQLTPDFIGQRVMSISRSIFYETYRDDVNAPLVTTVLDALNKKYGAPISHKPRNQNNSYSKGIIYWAFAPDESKSWSANTSYPCSHYFSVMGPDWGAISKDKNFLNYKKRTGDLTDERCGPYIRAEYQNHGERLRYLTVTLVDTKLIADAMQQTYIKLRGEKEHKEKRLHEHAKTNGVTPKL